jgi:hypothetical protein
MFFIIFPIRICEAHYHTMALGPLQKNGIYGRIFLDGFLETVCKKFIMDSLIKLSIKLQKVLTKPSLNF